MTNGLHSRTNMSRVRALAGRDTEEGHVADDEVTQITTPLGYTFLAPIRSARTVSRIRGLTGVSTVARALHDHYKIGDTETPPAPVPWPKPPPHHESHELLS